MAEDETNNSTAPPVGPAKDVEGVEPEAEVDNGDTTMEDAHAAPDDTPVDTVESEQVATSDTATPAIQAKEYAIMKGIVDELADLQDAEYDMTSWTLLHGAIDWCII